MPIESFIIAQTASLRDAVQSIDSNRGGIVLIVDTDSKLIATMTDGDARRAILGRHPLATVLSDLLHSGFGSSTPHTVGPETAADEALAIMLEVGVRQLPVIDNAGIPVGIHLQDEISRDLARAPSLGAVIMAGGFGTRMRPLTEEVPKPMLPVDGEPLMEKTIRHMHRSGIKSVNVTTHYLGEKIEEHFGDGARFGLDISYVDEEQPLGTAGALTLLERPTEATLILNGDVLTDLDFRKMHEYHREHKVMMTMAVREYSMVVPYGVVESEGTLVKRVLEKPRHEYFINAGIYILEPEAFDHIPQGEQFNMTDLVDVLIDRGDPVAIFPIHEYWLDIGHLEDYRRAEQDLREGRIKI